MHLPQSLSGFVTHLEQRRKHIGLLQLTGKLEGYLTHEYVTYLFYQTEGSAFGLTNLGRSQESQVDIVMLRKQPTHPSQEIYELIEAKYFRNRHRNWRDASAFDEVTPSLKSLAHQLAYRPGPEHGFYPVNLGYPSPYGLVFASFVKREDDTRQGMKNDTAQRFLQKITQRAQNLGFHDIGSDQPTFHLAYAGQPVAFHGLTYQVSLAVGVWLGAPAVESPTIKPS